MTTSYLTKILKQILEKENKSFGLFNFSHPISKYELLCNLNKISAGMILLSKEIQNLAVIGL